MSSSLVAYRLLRLVVVRHGATQHNLDGQLTGQIDAPLSALGRRQAEATAGRLASWTFDEIVASDLARARETAEMISAHHAASLRLDPDLREIDMGSWSGKPYHNWTPDERERFVAMERDATGLTSAPGGESFSGLANRVERALARARKRGGSVAWRQCVVGYARRGDQRAARAHARDRF